MLLVGLMTPPDAAPAAGLQRLCFPPPFPEDHLFSESDYLGHLNLFPEGQFVVKSEEVVVGAASSLLINRSNWRPDLGWSDLAGDLRLSGHDPFGHLLFAADISVHPDHRQKGIARLLYQARFDLVQKLSLEACVTVCRLPDFCTSGQDSPVAHAVSVVRGHSFDRTLTPLLKLGMRFVGLAPAGLDDPESGQAAGRLEWRP